MRGEEDLGLFGPQSVSWRVHADPILGLAGLRALYLQALHPRAIAGVLQNSAYRRDAWGRLRRTAEYVQTVIYGTTAEAQLAGARVRRIHAGLTARDRATGEVFRVADPHLLRWVHVTEVESFVTTARRAGLKLGVDEVDRYYAEQVRAAELVGLDPVTVPATRQQVDDYYRAIRPELRATSDALEAARFLTLPPMPAIVGLSPARPAWIGVASVAFALLPRWARRLYKMPGLPTTDVSATLVARSLRRALTLLPPPPSPSYAEAMQRARSAGLAAEQLTPEGSK